MQYKTIWIILIIKQIMENIIFELRKEEIENIFGGEKYLVFVWDKEGNCVPKYINI